MIDINAIRKNPERFRKAIEQKRIALNFDALMQVLDQHRVLLGKVQALRHERNRLADATAAVPAAERALLIEEGRNLARQLTAEEAELKIVDARLNELLLYVPSLPDPGTPVGLGEADNVEMKRWGTPKAPELTPRDHVELARMHNMVEFERARNFAGSRAYALKGFGALLEIALIRFALDHLMTKGFTPVTPPVMVRENAMIGTGYFPVGAENAYRLEQDDLYLVGTAEVPLMAMYADTVFTADELPLRLAGVSTCFRREVGAAGKDTRGLYRMHQFQKVEQVVIIDNEDDGTAAMHAEILQNAEELLQLLELPYRVVVMCTAELGLGQVRKHDIETWMPSRGAYCETHSCSTLNDFQARRLNIKFNRHGRKAFVHTLNNTAIASPRILIPILENHQQPDGTIYIPHALRPYLGNRERLDVAQ